jgi:mRNA-degrading endonuclease toxin of MazEF toxin-antitoxin module
MVTSSRSELQGPRSRRRRVRIPTEVPLGPDEGLPTGCVAAFEATTVFSQAMLVRRIGALSPTRIHELCDAIAAATDC